MEFGFVFNRMAGDPVGPNRSFADWIGEAGRIMDTASRAGFSFIALPGRQSLLTFARLSAVSGNLRVSTEVLTMPMLSAPCERLKRRCRSPIPLYGCPVRATVPRLGQHACVTA